LSLMLEEIRQQPDVLARILQHEGPKIHALGETLRSRDIRIVILVARGSSDNAAQFGRYLLEIATGIPVSLAAPSVYTLYHAKLHLQHALVVGVSQSGEGEDINCVLAEARAAGAFTVGITNEPGSTMLRTVDVPLLIHGGRERSVAATKTFTGQMMIFYLLAEALAGPTVATKGHEAIPEFCARALDHEAEIRELAPRYTFMENCVVIGRGLLYGNAFELALKLMETCYVVAERFSSADFFHGPLAMVERHFPVFLFACPGPMVPGIKALVERLRELRAEMLSITSDEELAGASSRAVRMTPSISEFLAPIPYIIPGQLLAAMLSEAKGLDPDAPRALSKVTRTL